MLSATACIYGRRMKRLIAVMGFASLISIAPGGYSAEEHAEESARQQEPEPAKGDSRRSEPARLKELDRCKEEARGMKGPERARFMTDCLASDRYEK